jgi:EAL domain-containing protein (putative c-di-GMP-specific phosphodiesterase class I)
VVARAVGCEEGQGYYFGRPLPVGELEKQFSLSMPTADNKAT